MRFAFHRSPARLLSFTNRSCRLACQGLLLALLTLPAAAHAAKPAGATVGSTLADLMKQIDAAETAASAAGKSGAMEAGRQVAIAIGNAQNAFAESLDHKLGGKLNASIEGTLDQLQGAVTEVTTGTPQSLQQATMHAEEIITSLPFRPQEPRLFKVTPRFIVPAKDPYPISIRFNGSFEFASKADLLPLLTVNEHTYKPVSSTPGELSFSVPSSDIFLATTPAKTFQLLSGSLKIPWELAKLMGKKHTKETDTYKLYLTALPSEPGKVTFNVKGIRTDYGKPQKGASNEFHQCSTKNCGGSDPAHSWATHTDPGCQVVKGSSSIEVISSAGDWSKTLTGDDGDIVSYNISTIRHASGQPSGTVDFRIAFMEVCPHQVPEVKTTEVPLQWGESKTIPATPGTWTVSLEGFDGKHYDITESSLANPFLKVTPGDKSITVTTVDPPSVVWP